MVTHIDSPHDFFIQRAVMLPKIKEMSNTYNSMKSSLGEPTEADMFPGKISVSYLQVILSIALVNATIQNRSDG